MDSFTFFGEGSNPAFIRIRVIDGGANGEVHEYRDTRNSQVVFDVLNLQCFARKVIRIFGDFTKVDIHSGNASPAAPQLAPIFDISACGTWIASQESDCVVVRLLRTGTVIQKILCRAWHMMYVRERCCAPCEGRVWIIDCGQKGAVQLRGHLNTWIVGDKLEAGEILPNTCID